MTITGVDASLQTGDTMTVPRGTPAVSKVVGNSGTSISAWLTANSNVMAGPQALLVTSSGQNLTPSGDPGGDVLRVGVPIGLSSAPPFSTATR